MPKTSSSIYHNIQYNTVLYYTILYCTVLYCTVLYCTILYYTILYYTILYIIDIIDVCTQWLCPLIVTPKCAVQRPIQHYESLEAWRPPCHSESGARCGRQRLQSAFSGLPDASGGRKSTRNECLRPKRGPFEWPSGLAVPSDEGSGKRAAKKAPGSLAALSARLRRPICEIYAIDFIAKYNIYIIV